MSTKAWKRENFRVFGRNKELGFMCRFTCNDRTTFPKREAKHLPVLFLSLSDVFFTCETSGLVLTLLFFIAWLMLTLT